MLVHIVAFNALHAVLHFFHSCDLSRSVNCCATQRASATSAGSGEEAVATLLLCDLRARMGFLLENLYYYIQWMKVGVTSHFKINSAKMKNLDDSTKIFKFNLNVWNILHSWWQRLSFPVLIDVKSQSEYKVAFSLLKKFSIPRAEIGIFPNLSNMFCLLWGLAKKKFLASQ